MIIDWLVERPSCLDGSIFTWNSFHEGVRTIAGAAIGAGLGMFVAWKLVHSD